MYRLTGKILLLYDIIYIFIKMLICKIFQIKVKNIEICFYFL